MINFQVDLNQEQAFDLRWIHVLAPEVRGQVVRRLAHFVKITLNQDIDFFYDSVSPSKEVLEVLDNLHRQLKSDASAVMSAALGIQVRQSYAFWSKKNTTDGVSELKQWGLSLIEQERKIETQTLFLSEEDKQGYLHKENRDRIAKLTVEDIIKQHTRYRKILLTAEQIYNLGRFLTAIGEDPWFKVAQKEESYEIFLRLVLVTNNLNNFNDLVARHNAILEKVVHDLNSIQVMSKTAIGNVLQKLEALPLYGKCLLKASIVSPGLITKKLNLLPEVPSKTVVSAFIAELKASMWQKLENISLKKTVVSEIEACQSQVSTPEQAALHLVECFLVFYAGELVLKEFCIFMQDQVKREAMILHSFFKKEVQVAIENEKRLVLKTSHDLGAAVSTVPKLQEEAQVAMSDKEPVAKSDLLPVPEAGVHGAKGAVPSPQTTLVNVHAENERVEHPTKNEAQLAPERLKVPETTPCPVIELPPALPEPLMKPPSPILCNFVDRFKMYIKNAVPREDATARAVQDCKGIKARLPNQKEYKKLCEECKVFTKGEEKTLARLYKQYLL